MTAPNRDGRCSRHRYVGRLRSAAAAGGGTAGVTLPELLVVLVTGLALLAAAVTLIVGQGRAGRDLEGGLQAQAASRAVRDLVAFELRWSGGGALAAAETDSLAIRVDLARFVVCDTAADAAILFRWDTVAAANLAVPEAGWSFADSAGAEPVWADGWEGETAATGDAPRAACTAAGAPGSGPDEAYRRVEGWGAAFGSRPSPGALVRRYGLLSWRLAPSRQQEGVFLWRDRQELAGPFGSETRLSYRLRDGSVLSSVPPSRLAEVVETTLEGTALPPAGGDRGRRPLRGVWPLRDR